MATIIRGVFPSSESPSNLAIHIRRLVIEITTNASNDRIPRKIENYLSSTCMYRETESRASDEFQSRIAAYEQIDSQESLSAQDSFIIQPGEYYNHVDGSQDNPISRLLSGLIANEETHNEQKFLHMDLNDCFEELLLEQGLPTNGRIQNLHCPES